MSTNDLQALFANLKPKSREPSSSVPAGAATGAPTSQSVSTLPSSPPPPFSATNPLHMPNDSSVTMSQNNSNMPNSATAQSLLSLLNFGSAPSNTQPPTSARSQEGRDTATVSPGAKSTASAVELMAMLKGSSAPPSKNPVPAGSLTEGTAEGSGAVKSNVPLSDPSQDALLKILSKTQPSHSTRSMSLEQSRPGTESKSRSTETNGAAKEARNIVNNAPMLQDTTEKVKKENKPLFTYTNPFEALNASRQQTPNSSTSVPIPQSPIFKGINDIPIQSVENQSRAPREGTPEQLARRKKLTPRLPSARSFAREESLKYNDVVEPVPKQGIPESQIEKSASPSFADKETELQEAPAPTPPKGIFYDAEVKDGKSSNEAAVDEWEDAEESPVPESSARVVPVYNFPIKPFVSITLQLESPSKVGIRDDGVMEISRLKKEFDQLDRTLASATQKYIAYALVKNGGMRIIRQDDGSDRQVFKNSGDRVFNVSFCTTATSAPPSEDQAILGTGVSGAVYYATVSKDGNDLFDKNELDAESLIFPPWPPTDDNTAGGVLKTRAKRSSRHPEFFAIGRGKAIHLIWPATAMSPKYGVSNGVHEVDVEKFYQDRNLRVSTGKAGKDFVFSEDDSLIVSLDKTGRLRFWDIRELIEETNATAARVQPMTVDVPLLSLSTASPSEKSWPTSVLFVDKARPYTKGGALRYVLVGLRQNHTLQLWDIALSKAVQELNFPHENETDGICSVCYHPNSGIIVVGHPTRNSLFFIHLSAPRYTLSSSTTQAAYVQRVAAKDPEIPKPESTACMSGIREISFAEKGQLRSVEILPVHKPVDAPKVTDEKTPLFELYVVHSKGVTCLNVNKEDLGWNGESKVLNPVDAGKEGYVTLKELKLGSVIDESSQSKSPVEEAPPQSKSAKKKAKKAQQAVDTSDTLQPEVEEPEVKTQTVSQPNGPEGQADTANGDTLLSKESKKSKRKAAQAVDLTSSIKPITTTTSPSKPNESSPTKMDEKANSPETPVASTQPADIITTSQSEPISLGISGDWLDKELKKIEKGVSTEFRKELNNLYTNIQNDRMIQDSSAAARQEAILRLVSSSLSNNVEKSLSRILATQMQQVVVPAITGVTVQAVTGQVGDAVAKTLHSMIPHELSTQLPVAINTALTSPQMNRSLAETISQKIAKSTEDQLSDIMSKTILPSFRNMALSAAEKAAADVETRLSAEIRQFEMDRRHDTTRLEKLGQAIQGMAKTLQAMSDTQVAFQGQILRDRRQLSLMGETGSSRQVSTARLTPSPAPIARPTPLKPKTKEEIELEEITLMMESGKYEEGSIKWLQSTQPVQLFDNLFVRFTPEYLASDVSPLVAFSIAVTVGNSLMSNTDRRLEWISAAFDAVDVQDPEMADLSQHAPTLIGSLVQKLESLYMTVAERNPVDPVLRQIPAVVKKAKHIRDSLSSLRG